MDYDLQPKTAPVTTVASVEELGLRQLVRIKSGTILSSAAHKHQMAPGRPGEHTGDHEGLVVERGGSFTVTAFIKLIPHTAPRMSG